MLDAAIIGAPRAGTTALFDRLCTHPSIQGSTPKETYFFMDADHPLAARQEARGEPILHTAGLSAFERFFEDSTSGLRLEATTHHYYQETAQDMLPQFQPPPHVFLIVRQPALRIRSSFLFTKHNRGRIDPALTFDRYVDILLDGDASRLDRYYQSNSSLYIAKRELELSKYIVWLENWEEKLGTEHVHSFVFEEFAEDSRHVAEEICQILGVDPSYYDEHAASFESNETFLVRSPTLQRLAYEVGTRMPEGWLKQVAKSLYQWIQIREASSSDAPRTDRGIDRLNEYFKPWNKELADRSELDLSGWC